MIRIGKFEYGGVPLQVVRDPGVGDHPVLRITKLDGTPWRNLSAPTVPVGTSILAGDFVVSAYVAPDQALVDALLNTGWFVETIWKASCGAATGLPVWNLLVKGLTPMTGRDLQDWMNLQAILLGPVSNLPLPRRISDKLTSRIGNVQTLLGYDTPVLRTQFGLEPDEWLALQEVLHALRDHPGWAVEIPGSRA